MVVLGVVLAALMPLPPTDAQLNQNPDSGGNSSGCYCSVSLCGCAPPPQDCELLAFCRCGATCSRQCNYSCD